MCVNAQKKGEKCYLRQRFSLNFEVGLANIRIHLSNSKDFEELHELSKGIIALIDIYPAERES